MEVQQLIESADNDECVFVSVLETQTPDPQLALTSDIISQNLSKHAQYVDETCTLPSTSKTGNGVKRNADTVITSANKAFKKGSQS